MSCVEELPGLVQAAGEAKGSEVLLVSYDLMGPRADRAKVVAQVSEFVEKRNWKVPVVIFDPVDLDALNERFDLPGAIPVTLAFDKFGHLADREDGPSETERFAEMLLHAR